MPRKTCAQEAAEGRLWSASMRPRPDAAENSAESAFPAAPAARLQ